MGTGNADRYNSQELSEFRKIILNKITQKEELLKSLNKSLRNENGDDDTSSCIKTVEDSQESLLKEQTLSTISMVKGIISDLRYALIRIENKTYGVCRKCGCLISKERLNSVPNTTQCMACKAGEKHPVTPVYKSSVYR